MFEVLSNHEQQANNDFTIFSIALEMRPGLSTSCDLQIPLCRFLSKVTAAAVRQAQAEVPLRSLPTGFGTQAGL